MGRKKKTAEQIAPATPQYTPEEAALAEKWKLRPWLIVPGSLRGTGERPEFPGKKTLEIACGSCDEHRVRVITLQDCFQVVGCKDCSARLKKEAAQAKRQAKKEAK